MLLTLSSSVLFAALWRQPPALQPAFSVTDLLRQVFVCRCSNNQSSILCSAATVQTYRSSRCVFNGHVNRSCSSLLFLDSPTCSLFILYNVCMMPKRNMAQAVARQLSMEIRQRRFLAWPLASASVAPKLPLTPRIFGGRMLSDSTTQYGQQARNLLFTWQL